MFTSLSGGYAPILLLVLVAAGFFAKLRSVWLRFLLAILVPIAISLGWYFLPRLPGLFQPGDPDAWIEWGFIAATIWSFYAVPLCLVATIVLALLQLYWRKLMPANYSFQRTPVHRLRFVQTLRRRRR
ncbi:MAG: hypothetical protein ACTHMO_08710 [Rhodanobacteraceae bacterium]